MTTKNDSIKNNVSLFLFFCLIFIFILVLNMTGCSKSDNEETYDDDIIANETEETFNQNENNFSLPELPVDVSNLNAIIDNIILENVNKVVQFILKYLDIVWTFFLSLHILIRIIIYISAISACVGIVISHFLGIYRSINEWQKHPDHNLMYSYFINSGTYQRKKSYSDAHKLLRDHKWLLISFSGLAYRLGNYSNKSKILMFIMTFAYIPLAIIGIIEMFFRILLGTVWLVCINIIQTLLLFATKLISFLMIPISKIFDKTMQNVQYCPQCYNTFNLPEFVCPECKKVHKELIPGRCGVLFARCDCNKKFLPCTEFTGRSYLEAKCPACAAELPAGNPKNLSISLIGGESSGKTAYISAFSKSYIENANKKKKLTVIGKPKEHFDELSSIYNRGKTIKEPESRTYSLIHKYGKKEKNNLVIYDILAEQIISDSYPRSPKYFGYSDGIIVLIDPLSVRSVRDALSKNGDTRKTIYYSVDEIDKLIVQFKNQYAKICGISTGKMSKVPIAIVINKIDIEIINEEIGLDKINEVYNQNPSTYGNDIEEAKNKICRSYLEKLGLVNVLNNIDAAFSKVGFFPVSAIGHISEGGVKFAPIGVLNPIAWIVKENRSSISSIFSQEGLNLKLIKLYEKFINTIKSIKR